MRATVRVARANLRIWWRELIAVAILTAIAFAHANGAWFLAAYTGFMIGIGWAMGFSHRHGPLWEFLRRMSAKLDAAIAGGRDDGQQDRDDDRPLAQVRHLHRV